jgi:hypothetical protein
MDKRFWYLLLQIEGLASHVRRLSGVGGPVRSLLWRNVDLASAGSGKDADKTHLAGGITCHVTLTGSLEPCPCGAGSACKSSMLTAIDKTHKIHSTCHAKPVFSMSLGPNDRTRSAYAWLVLQWH